ncbi:MAG: EAL domain-containing protein [Thermomicrobiales bacterium]|nr:EAL domain-containing protein [Thermomicrobiales bacterium]
MTAPDLVLVVGDDHRVKRANAASARLLGVAPSELVGDRVEELLWPADPAGMQQMEDVLSGKRIATDRLLLSPCSGRGPARLLEGVLVDQRSARPGGDVTLYAREAVTVTPAADAAPSPDLLATIPAIAYTRDAGASPAIVYVSPGVEPLLGWSPADYAEPSDHWFPAVHPDDRERVREAVTQAMAQRQPLDIEYRVLARDGHVVWLRDMAAPDEDGVRWHGVQTDVSDGKAAEARLMQLAYYDSLTGLPNRRLCINRLQELLNQPGHPAVALLFLDLDRFKVINDGIGHAAGDELLVAVARRLSANVGERGSLGRFGGDEFVAILPYHDIAEVTALAELLLATLRLPFYVNGFELIVEGTIGIALASLALRTPEALLRAADVALYRAKAQGGNSFAVHDPRVDRNSPERLEREAELRRGIEHEQFQIAYQPVIDLDTGKILAVEALLRWRHPTRGLLPPSEFISLANESGLIVPLGRWVIGQACTQMRGWQERFPALRSLRVSVNLSAQQLREPSLVADVARALERSGLAPENLALEIKEGDAIADAKAIARAVQEFKRLGVKVTIDDFGKGWSAFGALTTFTVDDLKIDGSFTARLGKHPQDSEIVRALVDVAKAMGLDVTAGAVETGEQLALLRELGCDHAQGRHFAPPLAVNEMDSLLRRHAEVGAGWLSDRSPGANDTPGPTSGEALELLTRRPPNGSAIASAPLAQDRQGREF